MRAGALMDLGSVMEDLGYEFNLFCEQKYLWTNRMSTLLIPDPLRWHINKCLCNKRKGGMDLGSVNAPPPLEHRDSGVGWSLQNDSKNHSNVDPSGKLQAASLTATVGYDRIKTERKNKYEYKK